MYGMYECANIDNKHSSGLAMEKDEEKQNYTVEWDIIGKILDQNIDGSLFLSANSLTLCLSIAEAVLFAVPIIIEK